VRYRFIRVERANYPVVVLCRVLQVARTGFYAWCKRPRSARSREDEVLGVEIAAVHAESRKTYGSPRVHAELRARGRRVGRKRVARLMRAKGLAGRKKRRFRTTTDSKHDLPVAQNLLDRNFVASAPNEKWVTDITYIWTWQGWLYLAVVLDLFSRRVVGWSIADHMRTELPLDALEMALGRRRPPAGLMHHSDRGSQYASGDYSEALEAAGIVRSMSRSGDCWDNAAAESFFSTLKHELLYRRPWPTRREAKAATVEWIEGFYNSKRRHSHLRYRTPMEHEKLFHAQQRQVMQAA